MRGYAGLALFLGVFSIVAAVNGDWTVFGLAYLDAIGMTALAATERAQIGEVP